MFSQAPFLLAFVAKQLGYGEPFDGLLIASLVRRNHPRQGRGHFGAQRDLALAFVFEVVELTYDLSAAFSREEFERFERRAVVFAKSIAPGGVAPFIENILANVRAP